MGVDAAVSAANNVSVPVAWATFGGSTCLLFLLCYLCQKKLQDVDGATPGHSPHQVYVISSVRAPSAVQPENYCITAPPPDYQDAPGGKIPDDDPPPYDSALFTRSVGCGSFTL